MFSSFHGDLARGTPYIGLYREAPPERGTFCRLQVYKRVGISQVEVYEREGKSVIYLFKSGCNELKYFELTHFRHGCLISFIEHYIKVRRRCPF